MDIAELFAFVKMEWEKMEYRLRRGIEEEKDTLKTPPIIIETCWAPGFLNIKALDEIINEPEPRRTAEGFVGLQNRRETNPVARRYSLRHYRDLIMSSSFESLNLDGFASSISLTPYDCGRKYFQDELPC